MEVELRLKQALQNGGRVVEAKSNVRMSWQKVHVFPQPSDTICGWVEVSVEIRRKVSEKLVPFPKAN